VYVARHLIIHGIHGHPPIAPGSLLATTDEAVE
jgi:hypothetical protein